MKPNAINRKPMYENAMTESVGMKATCNSCDRIIYEDENWKEQYKENGGYCKDCHESEEQETKFYEYLDKEDSGGTFGREPAKDESKEVKEGGDLFTGGEWFVDAGDFDRLQEADEIYLRSIDGDETFDICNFGCDETGNAKENALIAAQSKNMYYALKQVLKDFEQWPCLPSTQRMIEKILLKASPKK